MENLIEIKNLHASIDGKEILKGIDLTVKPGEVHAIMGPNGSGKSTLSNVLVGHPAYTVTEGEIIYKGENLLALSPEERSHAGIFLSFQYPVEISGVSMTNFMRAAINAKREALGQPAMSAADFIKPDIVHVLYNGKIVKTAGPELALELEERGYDWIKNPQ